MFKKIILLILWINVLSELVNGYSTWDINSNNRYQQNNNNNDYYYTSPAQTQTQYKYRTVQTGSGIYPHLGQKVHIGPDPNQTKTYLAKIDTTILTHRKKTRRLSGSSIISSHNRLQTKSCVKCPPENTLIAQRRLDGVLIEPPAALTCTTNQPYSRSLYEMETLFGPTFLFVLPQGTHSFIGKIRNGKTGALEQTCLLKYKVVIRQCIRYRPKNRDIRATCDLGSIWGSECTFTCKNGGILSHQEPIICGDDLTWTGEEPTCQSRSDYPNEDENQIACELPIPPINGKFSCDINNVEPNYDNDLYTPNGSTCYVNCNRHYDIPLHLVRYTRFHCENGRWNSTMMDFCQKGNNINNNHHYHHHQHHHHQQQRHTLPLYMD